VIIQDRKQMELVFTPGVNYIETESDDVCTCITLSYIVIYIIIDKKISRTR
jgi:hypothetical protein